MRKKVMFWALLAMLLSFLIFSHSTPSITPAAMSSSILFVTDDHLSESVDTIKSVHSTEALLDKIGADIKGIVIDSGLLSVLSTKNKEALRSVVDSGIPVIYIGKDVRPGYVARQLNINKLGGESKSGVYNRLVAEGLFRRPDGLYHTITITVPVAYEITLARLLTSIQEIVFATPMMSYDYRQ